MHSARAHTAEQFAIYGRLPSYRDMVDHEGYPGPQDAALIGNEKAVSVRIDELRGAGVDEFVGLSLRPLPRTPRPHPRTPARVRRYNRDLMAHRLLRALCRHRARAP